MLAGANLPTFMVPGTGIEPVWEIALPTDFKCVLAVWGLAKSISYEVVLGLFRA